MECSLQAGDLGPGVGGGLQSASRGQTETAVQEPQLLLNPGHPPPQPQVIPTSTCLEGEISKSLLPAQELGSCKGPAVQFTSPSHPVSTARWG